MAGKGMFGRLTGAFQGEGEKEETHADILAELKAEVQAIQRDGARNRRRCRRVFSAMGR